MKYLIYFTIATIIFFFSCSKNTEPTTFYWDETGCSDPWLDFYTADSFTQVGQYLSIEDYLSSENIELISVTHFYDSTKSELCLACFCKTGKIFELTIPKKDKRKINKLGINQFDLHFYK